MLLSDWNVRRSCESENTSRNRQRYFGYEVLIKFRKEEITDDRKAQMKRFAAIRTKMSKYTDIDKKPNLVQFFGVLLEPEVGTVSEYLGGGTMEELLDKSSANF
nr:mitogen-activated protein kinase kinase kinase 20 [Ipomoea batatas]